MEKNTLLFLVMVERHDILANCKIIAKYIMQLNVNIDVLEVELSFSSVEAPLPTDIAALTAARNYPAPRIAAFIQEIPVSLRMCVFKCMCVCVLICMVCLLIVLSSAPLQPKPCPMATGQG